MSTRLRIINNIRRRALLGFSLAVGTIAICEAAPASGSSVQAQKNRKTPVQISKELLIHLQNNKLPWQFYHHYAEIYNGFAKQLRASITKKTAKAKAKHIRAVAAYYDGLGNKISAMSKQKRTVDSIRRNNSLVPPMDRQKTYKAAMIKHRAIRGNFIEMLKNPPKRAKRTTIPTDQ